MEEVLYLLKITWQFYFSFNSIFLKKTNPTNLSIAVVVDVEFSLHFAPSRNVDLQLSLSPTAVFSQQRKLLMLHDIYDLTSCSSDRQSAAKIWCRS